MNYGKAIASIWKKEGVAGAFKRFAFNPSKGINTSVEEGRKWARKVNITKGFKRALSDIKLKGIIDRSYRDTLEGLHNSNSVARELYNKLKKCDFDISKDDVLSTYALNGHRISLTLAGVNWDDGYKYHIHDVYNLIHEVMHNGKVISLFKASSKAMENGSKAGAFITSIGVSLTYALEKISSAMSGAGGNRAITGNISDFDNTDFSETSAKLMHTTLSIDLLKLTIMMCELIQLNISNPTKILIRMMVVEKETNLGFESSLFEEDETDEMLTSEYGAESLGFILAITAVVGGVFAAIELARRTIYGLGVLAIDVSEILEDDVYSLVNDMISLENSLSSKDKKDKAKLEVILKRQDVIISSIIKFHDKISSHELGTIDEIRDSINSEIEYVSSVETEADDSSNVNDDILI